MLAHAQPGGSAFMSCLRLFHGYPLAVRRHYAEHRYGSMVLADRAAGTTGFSVLIMEREDLFVIRPWDRRAWARVEIRPDTPVPGHITRLIESGTPVPRDGALLGWVVDRVVRGILLVYGRLTEPWDDASAVPGILALPLAGSEPADWPALPANPLNDERLWDWIERGQLADLGTLISQRAGRVFWVPGADDGIRRRPAGRIVVTERMGSGSFWLLAGVYADGSTQRESVQLPAARYLLARPGVLDLARGYGQRQLLGV